MGRRSMRPDSESLCAQWRWFLIRLLILIGILYLLFGCIFGITTVKSEDMAPRISAGDLVLYYRLDKQPLAGDIIICNKNGKQYVDRVIAKARRFGRNYRGRNGKSEWKYCAGAKYFF